MKSPFPLSTLLRYLNAPPARRGASIRKLRAEADSAYAPETDFWLPMRHAIAADRRTTRDGGALRAAAKNATERRRPSYDRAAQNWVTVAERWETSTAEPAESSSLVIGGLTISVRPSFAERRPDGTREIGLVWFTKEPPSDDVVRAAQLVISLAYPGCTAIVVDLPRSVVHAETSTALESLAPWLAAEVAGLVHLLTEAA